MELKIKKNLYQELFYHYERMATDTDFKEDNKETLHITLSIYEKLLQNIKDFSIEEVLDIVNEFITCEDTYTLNCNRIKNELKLFWIENGLCHKMTEKEIENTEVWSSSGRKRKAYDYIYKGHYYTLQTFSEIKEMLLA